MLVVENMNEMYATACRILHYPDYVCSPRGQAIEECTDICFRLLDPYSRIVSMTERDLSLRYLVGELSFYLSGSDSLNFISHYSKFWLKVTDNGSTVNSAYGKRLFRDKYNGNTQFRYALGQLIKDKGTRKSVMMIYSPSDNILVSNDNPCTLSLQFLIRDNKLNLTVNMRSNDVWFGFPYDVAFFTFVQERMMVAYNDASSEKVDMGVYTHFVGSFHVYEKDWNKVDECSNTSTVSAEGTRMPKMSSDFEKELPLYLEWEKDNREGRINGAALSDPLLQWFALTLEETK